jgi:hypothetical protein
MIICDGMAVALIWSIEHRDDNLMDHLGKLKPYATR